MVYVSKDGEERVLWNSTIVFKTLSVEFDNGSYNQFGLGITSLMKIVYRYAGQNCVEAKYKSFFKRETGIQCYSFDLYFQVGRGLKYKDRHSLNEVMWEIEQAAVKELGCLPTYHNHSPQRGKDKCTHGFLPEWCVTCIEERGKS